MPSPPVCLRSVVRVTPSSVFLAPQEGETLPFQTVCSAPPVHRGALQRNGLIAKVCLGVRFSVKQPSAATRESIKQRYLSLQGRVSLWHAALSANGLVSQERDDLRVAPSLGAVSWPLLTEAEYEARMQYFERRFLAQGEKAAAHLVPILALQKLKYRESGLLVNVGVVWMPRYRSNLREWAESQGKLGQVCVPERRVVSILHDAARALEWVNAHRHHDEAAQRVPGNKEVTAPSSTALHADRVHFTADCLLLVSDTEDVVFALAPAMMSFTSEEQTAIAKLRGPDLRPLSRFPELAPECIVSSAEELFDRAKSLTWSLGSAVYGAVRATSTPASRPAACRLPLNHPSLTPDAVIACLRADLSERKYSSALVSVFALLLCPDPLTRPSLQTARNMLADHDRAPSVLRFPFALGDYQLLALPSPDDIQLNPVACRYVSSAECCVCKKGRNHLPCKCGTHSPAATSPSWTKEEWRLGLPVDTASSAAYLYPLAPASLDATETLRLVKRAVQGSPSTRVSAEEPDGHGRGVNEPGTSVHTTPPSLALTLPTVMESAPTVQRKHLFQLFGGFACFQRGVEGQGYGAKDRAAVMQVLVPFPDSALRESERMWAVQKLSFTAALPWQSACTGVLQRRGRVCATVPYLFSGGARRDGGAEEESTDDAQPRHYAWILPGEQFTLADGHQWVPAPDGGFVFWFSETLVPTDKDRYFAVAGSRFGTESSCVMRTLLPGKIFAKHAGKQPLSATMSYADVSQGCPVYAQGSAACATGTLRRRESQGAALVELPTCDGIIEDEQNAIPKRRASLSSLGTSSVASPLTPQASPHSSIKCDIEATSGSACRNRCSGAGSCLTNASCESFRKSEQDAPRTRTAFRQLSMAQTRLRRRSSLQMAVVSSAGCDATVATVTRSNSVTGLSPSPLLPVLLPRLHSEGFSPLQRGACVSPIPHAPGRVHSSAPAPSSIAPAPGTNLELRRAKGDTRSSGAPRTVARRPPALSSLDINVSTEQGSKAGDCKTKQEAAVMDLQGLALAVSASASALPQDLLDGSVAVDVPSARSGDEAAEEKQPAETESPAHTAPHSSHTPEGVTADNKVECSPPVSIRAHWVSPSTVEASFNSLTYYVPYTREHGLLQTPVAVTPSLRNSLHCPDNAAYSAFMSASVPLVLRNHQHANVSGPLLLPHSGFAFYSSTGELIAVMALRCTKAAYLPMRVDEFPLILKTQGSQSAQTTSARDYCAAYFTPQHVARQDGDSDADGADSESLLANDSSGQRSPTAGVAVPRAPYVSPQDPQLLTFSSACKLVGDLTPRTDDVATVATSYDRTPSPTPYSPPHGRVQQLRALSSNANPDELLPVCWIGFETHTTTIMLGTVDQSLWYRQLLV